MKLNLIALSLFCISTTLQLNAQTYEWAKLIGSYNVTTSDVAIDKNDNIYITGTFSGTATFDNSSITSYGGNDIFIAKYNALGALQWVVGGGGTSKETCSSIALDSKGNCYIAGHYYSSGITLGDLNLPKPDNFSFFAKCDTNGTFKWIKSIEQKPYYKMYALDSKITLDKSDNIYLFDYGYQIMLNYPDTTKFSGDFIAKYTNNGVFEKVVNNDSVGYNPVITQNCTKDTIYEKRAYNGSLFTSVYDLNNPPRTISIPECNGCAISIPKIDKQSLYQTTNFSGTLNISNTNITSIGSTDGFLSKINLKSKQLEWTKTFGGIGYDTPNAMVIDGSENIIVSGSFTDEALFEDKSITTKGTDIFTASYDSNGNLLWVRKTGNDLSNTCNHLLLSNDKKSSYSIGTFSDQLGFDNDTLDAGTSRKGVFLAKMNCLPQMPEAITGDTLLCAGNSQYSLSSTNSSGIYQWSVSEGGYVVAASSTATINWTQAGVHYVSVSLKNDCGTGKTRTLKVRIKASPVISQFTGDTITCLGSETYSVMSLAETEYQWSVSGGNSILGIGNNAVANWAYTGIHQLSITAKNTCGQSATRYVAVQVKKAPDQPSLISGNTSTCSGTQIYSVNAQTGTDYFWNLSSGGSLLASSNVANVSWTSEGTHSLSVTPSNLCGTGAPRLLSVQVSTSPAQPSTIVGDMEVCKGTQSYSIAETADVSYKWTLSGGGSISYLNGSASVIWTSPGTYTLSVIPSNQCGQGPARSVTVKVKDIPSTPSSILGLDNVCKSSQTYVTPASSGVNYIWSLSGGGEMIPSGNTASIDWKASGVYTLSVSPQNECGTGISFSKKITVKDVSSVSGGITGKENPCIESSLYSATAVDGFAYVWALSDGGTLTAASNTCTINWQTTGYHSLQVATSDGCASSLIVNVRDLPSKPTGFLGDSIICLGTNTYSVTAVADVDYLWELNDGGVLTASANTASVNWIKAGDYALKITPNNACGSGIYREIPIKVKITPATPSAISGKTQACLSSESYSVSSLPETDYIWKVSGNGILSYTAGSATISWAKVSENTVQVAASNLCGTSPYQSITVNVSDVPVQAIVSGNTSPCAVTSNYIITNKQTGTTYNWAVSGGNPYTTSNDTLKVNWQVAGNYTIKVNPSNYCGAGRDTTIAISVQGVPLQAFAISGNTDVCFGIESYQIPSSQVVDFNWSLPDGGSIKALGNSASINWIKAGTFAVTVTPVNTCGTGTSQTLQVKVSESPAIPSVILGDDAVCLGSKAYSVSKTSELSYNWILSGGGAVTSNDNSANVTWNQAGIYSLVCVASNQCGSSPARSKIITVKAIPEAATFQSGASSVCLGTSSYQLANISGSNYTWKLSGGGNLTASENIANINWSTPGLYSLTATSYNACGAASATVLNITVNTVPTITDAINGDSEVCLGTINYQINKASNVSYSWLLNGGGLLTASDNTASINWIMPGTYTLSVSPYNICGYGTSKSKTITIIDKPSQPSSISGLSTVCKNTSSEYQIENISTNTYNWSLTGGGVLSSLGNKTSVRWANTGEYILTVTPTNKCGTGSSRTTIVEVKDLPGKPTFTSFDSISCLTEKLYSVNKITDVLYNWTLASGGSIQASDNLAIVSWNQTGKHTISVSPYNDCGYGPASSLVINASKAPEITTAISGDTAVCLGYNSYVVPLLSSTYYQWILSSGGTASASSNQAIIKWQNEGSHELSVIPSNQCGNGNTVKLSVRVKPKPSYLGSISGSTELCNGISETYSVPAESYINYKWEVNHSATMTDSMNIARVIWTQDGTHLISVTPFNECGMGEKSSQSVTTKGIKPSITGAITGDSVACLQSKTLYSIDYIENTNYNWQISDSINFVKMSNGIMANWSATGRYHLSVYPSNLCGTGDTLNLWVRIEDAPAEPTISSRGDTLFSSSATGNQWLLDLQTLTGQNLPYYVPQKNGHYSVSVSNSCDKTVTSNEIYFSDKSFKNYGIVTWPNPASDYVTVYFPLNIKWSEVKLQTLSGALINTLKYNETSSVRIPVSNVSQGLYMLEITTELGTISRKIIVL